jgi:arylsulfatase A-like enzyme
MLRILLSLVAILTSITTIADAAAKKPNVILFLVDDMGWMDSTPYGSTYYETPAMQRFASRAMRFTDAYACPLCSPTRASILTSQYSARHGITTASGHQPPQPPGHNYLPTSASPNKAMIYPESKNYLEPSQYTLAEALRDAGWRTGHFGKWHLGLAEEYWPERQGFDVALHGTPDPGPNSYFSPGYYRTSQTFPDGPPGEYITDRLTDEVIKFIETNRDEPFFVNFWQHSLHGPWGFKKEYADKYVDKKDPRGQQDNPIMASMIQSVDESLDRIVAKLEELKLADNTIIVFFSDNGGNSHSNTKEETAQKNREKKQGEMIAEWRKYAGFQPPTNNTPLRDGKGTLYEGGVRVPLMVLWPGIVEAGSTSSAVVHAVDLYPTLLDALGIERNPKQVMDGVSFAPALKKTGEVKREAIFTFFPHGGPTKPPGVSVRKGDWKLIRWFETSSYYPDSRELYNLHDDLSESNNLAAKMPDRVAELDGLIDGFLKDTGALMPKPNPAYNTATAKKSKPTERDDRFDGWVSRFSETTMNGGTLTVSGGKNGGAFLGISNLKSDGPVTVKVRSRSGGGIGKLQWRTSDQETFPDKGQMVEFTLPAGDAWAEISVELPVAGSLAHLRVYLPAQQSPVEVDWIQLNSIGKRPQRWEFN